MHTLHIIESIALVHSLLSVCTGMRLLSLQRVESSIDSSTITVSGLWSRRAHSTLIRVWSTAVWPNPSWTGPLKATIPASLHMDRLDQESLTGE